MDGSETIEACLEILIRNTSAVAHALSTRSSAHFTSMYFNDLAFTDLEGDPWNITVATGRNEGSNVGTHTFHHVGTASKNMASLQLVVDMNNIIGCSGVKKLLDLESHPHGTIYATENTTQDSLEKQPCDSSDLGEYKNSTQNPASEAQEELKQLLADIDYKRAAFDVLKTFLVSVFVSGVVGVANFGLLPDQTTREHIAPALNVFLALELSTLAYYLFQRKTLLTAQRVTINAAASVSKQIGDLTSDIRP